MKRNNLVSKHLNLAKNSVSLASFLLAIQSCSADKFSVNPERQNSKSKASFSKDEEHFAKSYQLGTRCDRIIQHNLSPATSSEVSSKSRSSSSKESNDTRGTASSLSSLDRQVCKLRLDSDRREDTLSRAIKSGYSKSDKYQIDQLIRSKYKDRKIEDEWNQNKKNNKK